VAVRDVELAGLAALVEVAAEPPAHDLAHGGGVVVAVVAAHGEAAVLALAGQPSSKTTIEATTFGALHVRDVEALDPQRRVGSSRASCSSESARSGR
jgi:hypothetical protein